MGWTLRKLAASLVSNQFLYDRLRLDCSFLCAVTFKSFVTTSCSAVIQADQMVIVSNQVNVVTCDKQPLNALR